MRDERGGVSLVVCSGTLVLCLIALCAADLGALLLARARAQSAADAAALASVVQQAPALSAGQQPIDAARAEAEANGAHLVSCTCDFGTSEAIVVVTVTPTLAFVTPWFGSFARATSKADLDADVLTYRSG